MTIRWNTDGHDHDRATPNDRGPSAEAVDDNNPTPVPDASLDRLQQAADAADLSPWSSRIGSDVVGVTMYDMPGSEDGTLTVLLPRERIGATPGQALVRISSGDGRVYLGIVVAGPFAEPDGLRADANLIVTTSVRSQPFQPQFHGRVRVELLGEEIAGTIQPPRFRPLPNSTVTVLSDAETARVLQVDGDMRLGQAVGHQAVTVGIPSDSKHILPRHLGIVGTTGGGKSTTVAGLVAEAQRAGLAVVLLDVEGEYTRLHEPTTDPTMIRLLHQAGRSAVGVPNTHLYRLSGRDTTNEDHPRSHTFGLRFSDLSPFTVAEILELNEAQQERYFLAYDLAKSYAADGQLDGPPVNTLDLDDFETGCPGVTLHVMIDVVNAFIATLDKSDLPTGRTRIMREPSLTTRIRDRKSSSGVSWKAVRGRLLRLDRLGAFDLPVHVARPLDSARLLEPGTVHIIDLSDVDGNDLRNIVIADLMRGIQRAQDDRYAAFEKSADAAQRPRTLVIIEEAHEFLARSRVNAMPILYAQIERIAKRGRKRWLGLVFVTQLPQHLAPQVSNLINGWIMHKLGDPAAVSDLRGSVSGIDDSLWRMVRSLAPGQAVVALGHMTRPVLTAIDPTGAQLRMVD